MNNEAIIRGGFDLPQRDYSWMVLAVQKPCVEVAQSVSQLRGVQQTLGGVDDIMVAEQEEENLLLAYQFRGQAWTVVDRAYGRWLDYGWAEELSRQCQCLAFVAMYEDVAGTFGYSLFNRGEGEEEYVVGAPDVDESRDYYLSRGFVISDDERRMLRTARRAAPDLNAPDAESLPRRLAEHVGLYVPFDVWRPSAGKVELLPPWKAEDLVGAVGFVLEE